MPLSGRRHSVPSSPVQFGDMPGGARLPRLATPAFAGADLAAWASAHAATVRAELDAHGALLFRGFGIATHEALETVSRHLCARLAGYVERRSPRVSLSEEVFTSTIYPADQYIHFHNEKSYAHDWPMQLHFCCIRPAEQGGWTPLADSRRVLERLSPGTRAKFAAHGVRYVRRFDDRAGLSWQETFQTADRAEVERFCAGARIHLEWQADGRLQTWQDRHAMAVHPRTGETVWFNQAHYFHPRAMPSHVAGALSGGGPDAGELPQQTCYGNGEAIADETIDEILAAYRAEEAGFPWERGDLLVIDNMKVAHARTPFTGARLIALTLGDVHAPRYAGGGLVE